ncbi:prolyl oligopeptidase family serine peptidase [Faecalibacter sp. LW9]|uniref:S9 family peptidase n=1 Tax=Faecalibacter sp. LW9 TaxID=3103144 RepID=UPI002B002FAD|nr:prolyl oligopeptidase family serine peptidase [Faecalibacter sp. LW9]
MIQHFMSKSKAHVVLDYAQDFIKKKALVLAAVTFITTQVDAQKKPLDHTVYDEWQSIGYSMLSNDGNWVAYQVKTQESDNTLAVFGIPSQKSLEFHRGDQVKFTADSKFAIFNIKPFYKDLKEVRIKKKKEHEIAKDSIGIVNLSTQKVEKLPNLKSFKVPEKEGSFVAYLLHKEEKKDSVKGKDKKAEPKIDGKKDQPLDLVLRNLVSGKKETFKNVVNYDFSDNGKHLVFTTKPEKKDSTDKTKYGVYLINTSTFTKQLIVEGKGDFKQFSFDENGSQIAFVGTREGDKVKSKTYQFYHAKLPLNGQIDSISLNSMPADWVVSEHRKPNFSKSGKNLFIGIAPKPIEKDTTLIAEDHAKVDIWHWNEDYTQPMQLKNLEREKKRSYLAYINPTQPNQFVQLADASMNQIDLVNEGDAPYAIGISDNMYRLSSQWDASGRRDYYMVDIATGKREPIVIGLVGRLVASPSGKYIVYYNRETHLWYSYNPFTKQTVELNKKLKVSFEDEENDMPTEAREYGIAYFTRDDQTVLIKDRYDIWEFDLAGKKKPDNITNGFGRKNNMTFNIQRLNDEIKTLDRQQTIYLTAFDNKTKATGVFKTMIEKSKNPELVTMTNMYAAQNMRKAKDADVYVYSKESVINPADVYVSKDFIQETKVSNLNPQQKDYIWETSELVEWKTYSGKKASGVLYKPENFDENKQYPMIVYFYEKMSDNLHRYQEPAPTRSRLNHSYFVSNGYLVFTPDISYIDGQPGKSAEDYINSGVEHLKKNKWVKGDKIGIQGQSWGGYQVAHLITRTNMYAAAWAGAPVWNMTSAYGGIRWGTGMSRQFQYERTQSRIGKKLWEAKDLYIENSPLFFTPNVNTPVAIMHNDEDGAVPWYQGIEMFMSLRRLGKPAWLLNYNNDDHNLMNRANRNDIQKRQQQFFDHYLKDAPAPKWMTTGVPATLKGVDWGFDYEENPTTNK